MRTVVRSTESHSAPEASNVSSAVRSGEFVQSLERGLSVITAFTRETPSQTLSEIAERTGLTRAAARRFLLTLRDLGYVESDGRFFSLRPRVPEPRHCCAASLPAWAIPT